MRQLLACLAAWVVALPAAADVVVNNNLGATGTSQFTQSGSSTIVFGSTVLVAFNDSGSFAGTNNQFTGYARSTDGGFTFADMGRLPTNPLGDAGYAHLARHDATGTVYSTALAFSTGAIQLFRSTDGGITFAPPVNAAPGVTGANFNAIAVDNAAGAGNGNVYVVTEDFSAGGGLRLARSTDGGLTFSSSILLSSGGGNGGRGPSITVAPNHRVTVAYLDITGATPVIRVRSSTDAGLTFGAAVAAATLTGTQPNGDLRLFGQPNLFVGGFEFRSNAHPQLVANPVTGQLYMVYAADGPGIDKANILLRTSSDGGLTWSAEQRINSDAGTNDQWQPTLTVTPDGKNVGIFWYDRRNDDANNLIEYYGRQCAVTAGVLACGADFVVSDQPFLPEFGRDALLSPTFMGDYDNAASDDGFFYVSWGDNRLPLAGGGDRFDPNVFFDRVAIGGDGGGGGGVPEPATLWLVAAPLLALAGLRRSAADHGRAS